MWNVVSVKIKKRRHYAPQDKTIHFEVLRALARGEEDQWDTYFRFLFTYMGVKTMKWGIHRSIQSSYCPSLILDINPRGLWNTEDESSVENVPNASESLNVSLPRKRSRCDKLCQKNRIWTFFLVHLIFGYLVFDDFMTI